MTPRSSDDTSLDDTSLDETPESRNSKLPSLDDTKSRNYVSKFSWTRRASWGNVAEAKFPKGRRQPKERARGRALRAVNFE